MADIHHQISLGIGSPASIGFFIRFGLAGAEAEALTAAPHRRTWVLEARRTTWTVPSRETTWTLATRDTIWYVPEE